MISARVSGLYNRHDEILENNYPLGATGNTFYPFGVTGPGTPRDDDTWNDETWGVRAQILFEPNDRVELLVSGYATETTTSVAPYQSVATTAIVDSQGRVVDTVYTPRTGPLSRCEAIAVEGGCVSPTEILPTGFPRLPTEGVDGELLPTTFDIGAAFLGLPPAALEDGLRPVPGGSLLGYVDPDGSGFHTSKDFGLDDLNQFGTYGITAKVTWELEDATFTSVTDYKQYPRDAFLDIDASPAPQSMFQTDTDQESFTEEVRLNGEFDRVRWVAGFYYLFIDTDVVTGIALPSNSPLLGSLNAPDGSVIPGLRAPFFGTEANNLVKLETNSYSLFGQVDYDLTENLTLVAGVRGIVEEKDYEHQIAAFFNSDDTEVETETRVPGTGIDGNGTLQFPFSDSTSDFLWAGKLQLEYSPHADWLLYAGVNRGVKAGSFNAKLADGTPFLSDERFPYDEEVLLAYEAGFKSTLFDGTTRVSGSFYYYDYSDY